MTRLRLHAVRPRPAATLVNAGESRSVVGSENDIIARATSILIGFERDGMIHDARNPIYWQAREIVAWAGQS